MLIHGCFSVQGYTQKDWLKELKDPQNTVFSTSSIDKAMVVACEPRAAPLCWSSVMLLCVHAPAHSTTIGC